MFEYRRVSWICPGFVVVLPRGSAGVRRQVHLFQPVRAGAAGVPLRPRQLTAVDISRRPGMPLVLGCSA